MSRLWLLVTTAVAPLTWGTTYVVTTELLPPDRPLLTAVIRSLPAGLLLVALTRTLPSGQWRWKAAVLGALNIGAFQALLFVSAYRLPGGVAATFGAAGPLVVAALAIFVLGERVTGWRLGWGVAGLAGVGLVVLRPEAALDPLGALAGILGTVSMAAGTVLTRKWGQPVGLLAFTGWQLALGGLMLAPVALVVEGPPPSLDPAAVCGYLWLGLVGSLLAYALWFRGLARLRVGQAAFLPLLSPVVATVLGWFLLGETLGRIQAVGFAVAMAAIVAAQLTPPRRLRIGGGTARRGTSPATMATCASRSADQTSSHTADRAPEWRSTRSVPTCRRSTRAPTGSSATSGSPRTATSSACTTAGSTGPPTPVVSSRR